MPYRYDVFISYTWRVDRARRWVRDVLHTPLMEFLQLEAGIPPERLFLDERVVRPGMHVETAVHEAIRDSKVMLAVLSPQYFESGWCLTEFYSMLERQRSTGCTLIHPLGVWDGKLYHADAIAIGPRDYNRWNSLERNMVRKKWNDTVKALAIELAGLAAACPPHDPSWSVTVVPDPPEAPIRREEY